MRTLQSTSILIIFGRESAILQGRKVLPRHGSNVNVDPSWASTPNSFPIKDGVQNNVGHIVWKRIATKETYSRANKFILRYTVHQSMTRIVHEQVGPE